MTTDATSDVPLMPSPPGMPAVLSGPADDLIALLEPTLDHLAEAVAAVGPDQSALATPCPYFDVAGLLDHVLGWLQFFAAALADPVGTTTRPDPTSYRAADDPRPKADVVRAATKTLTACLHGGVLGGTVRLSQARMEAPAALGMLLGEYLVHGWDLRRALGLPWTPDARACETALGFFRGMILPEYRGAGGYFGEEIAVPDGAPIADRLLGMAGRDPGWTA